MAKLDNILAVRRIPGLPTHTPQIGGAGGGGGVGGGGSCIGGGRVPVFHPPSKEFAGPGLSRLCHIVRLV